MQKQNLNWKNVLFWADVLLAAVSLVCTAYILQDIYDGLSFGGFGALFMLLVLSPYFMALAGAVVLLLRFVRPGRRWPAAVAAVLEIIGPIPWIWLVSAFGYPLSWYELLMVACAAAGVLLLISLPVKTGDGTPGR